MENSSAFLIYVEGIRDLGREEFSATCLSYLLKVPKKLKNYDTLKNF